MKTTAFKTVLGMALIGLPGSLLVSTVSGCSRTSATTLPRSTPCHLIVGIDASLSARKYLGAYALLTAQLASRLEPNADFLTLYRVDRQACEFSHQKAEGSREALLKTIITEVKRVSGQQGTYPARFWQTVVKRTTNDKQRMVVVLFTDGENTSRDNTNRNTSSRESLQIAARQLAAHSQIQAVVVCGAEPQTWSELRECFAPLKDRFHLYGPTEMNIDHLAEHLSESR